MNETEIVNKALDRLTEPFSRGYFCKHWLIAIERIGLYAWSASDYSNSLPAYPQE